MQIELAQIISLTSFGNEFLRTSNCPDNYFPGNSVFQFCNKVDFKNVNKSSSPESIETVVANNPVEWFETLKKEDCKHLRLYYVPAEYKIYGPEYNLAGFVGGAGPWMIETNFGEYSHYWFKRWEVGNKNAPDKKIWNIKYCRTVERFRPANQQQDTQKLRAQLEETIKQLIDFCNQQQLKGWLETFEKANSILSDLTPNQKYYHSDLVVLKNYSISNLQLLFSASTSWVFGGMGWWNDMGFSDKAVQEQYLNLSQKLYEQIIQSILAVTNSF